MFIDSERSLPSIAVVENTEQVNIFCQFISVFGTNYKLDHFTFPNIHLLKLALCNLWLHCLRNIHWLQHKKLHPPLILLLQYRCSSKGKQQYTQINKYETPFK